MSRQSLRPRTRFETIAWLALVVFIGYRIWPQGAAAFGVASANAPVPAFELATLDGQTISSHALRGKVVLVNFWATWCPPCRVEMPGFQAEYDRRQKDGFVVLGIATDGDRDQVDRFLTEHHITYPIAMASGTVVQRFGGVNVLPTSFLIDREGRIRNEVRGFFAPLALREAVDHLLADTTTTPQPSPLARRALGATPR